MNDLQRIGGWQGWGMRSWDSPWKPQRWPVTCATCCHGTAWLTDRADTTEGGLMHPQLPPRSWRETIVRAW